MQKITLCLSTIIGLLVLTGCMNSVSQKATPEAAQNLIKLRGYDFNEQGFFAAAQARDQMAITAFIDAGINMNAKDSDGRTVLNYAAARGHLDVVTALVGRGADPNVEDRRGYTALSHAVEAKYDDVADVLLDRPGLDPNCRGLNARPVLVAYAWRNDKRRVEKLLARGADVNEPDADLDTPLHGAAQGGDVEVIRMLLDKGAKVNAKNKVGGTPLMWAAVYGHHDAAKLLLDRGADASVKDAEGNTAADWAVRNNRDELVQLLTRHR